MDQTNSSWKEPPKLVVPVAFSYGKGSLGNKPTSLLAWPRGARVVKDDDGDQGRARDGKLWFKAPTGRFPTS
jgi:hypothetical protein